MATDRVVLALGIVGREVRASAIVNRVAPIRRHPHPYPVRTRSHSSSSRSETVANAEREHVSAGCLGERAEYELVSQFEFLVCVQFSNPADRSG
jgi:hypothetical protein